MCVCAVPYFKSYRVNNKLCWYLKGNQGLNKLNCFTALAARLPHTLAPLSCRPARGLRVSPWAPSRPTRLQPRRRHKSRCPLPRPFQLQGSPWPWARSSVPGCSMRRLHKSVLRRSFDSHRQPYWCLCKKIHIVRTNTQKKGELACIV